MNREIKFRMFVGGQMINNVGVHPFLMIRHHNDDGELMDNNEEGCFTTTPKEETLMQYTGLKDKNGKEIYEGDKFKGLSDDIDYYEVFFKTGCFCMRYKIKDSEYYTWGKIDKCLEILEEFDSREIIGNIYENPELLTGVIK